MGKLGPDARAWITSLLLHLCLFLVSPVQILFASPPSTSDVQQGWTVNHMNGRRALESIERRTEHAVLASPFHLHHGWWVSEHTYHAHNGKSQEGTRAGSSSTSSSIDKKLPLLHRSPSIDSDRLRRNKPSSNQPFRTISDILWHSSSIGGKLGGIVALHLPLQTLLVAFLAFVAHSDSAGSNQVHSNAELRQRYRHAMSQSYQPRFGGSVAFLVWIRLKHSERGHVDDAWTGSFALLLADFAVFRDLHVG